MNFFAVFRSAASVATLSLTLNASVRKMPQRENLGPVAGSKWPVKLDANRQICITPISHSINLLKPN